MKYSYRQSKSYKTQSMNFKSLAAYILYLWELEGQISDGKYENRKPTDHWMWINPDMKVTINPNKPLGYSGDKHAITSYNLTEWVKYIRSNDPEYYWATRVLFYGKFATYCMDESVIGNQPLLGHLSAFVMDLGFSLENNPDLTFDEWKNELSTYLNNKSYTEAKEYITEEKFNTFKNSKYTVEDFWYDHRDMTKTVNTHLYIERIFE